MAWKVTYTPKVLKQLRALDKVVAARIETFFSERVAQAPDPQKLATALVGRFAGQHRFRVGDYRIICEIIESELVISVLKAGHRKDVYE